MNYEKFKPFLGSWGEKLKPFIEGEDCDKIYARLKSDSKKGITICPSSTDVYKAFEKCEWNKLKCVIIGQDPYPKYLNGICIADGMAFSCSNTMLLQPSLEKLYEAIEDDVYDGLALKYEFTPDLSYLAQQGVLLLNSALTVQKDNVGSHSDMWEPFIKFLLQEVFNEQMGLPIILMGKQAQRFQEDIPPFNMSYCVEHPAAASYGKRKMKHENCFSKVNDFLKGANGEEHQIQWLKKVKD